MYSGLLRFVLVLAASQLLNDTKKVEFRQLSEAPAIKEKKSVQSYQEIRTYMKLPHLKRTVRSYPPWPKLPDLTALFNNWFFCSSEEEKIWSNIMLIIKNPHVCMKMYECRVRGSHLVSASMVWMTHRKYYHVFYEFICFEFTFEFNIAIFYTNVYICTLTQSENRYGWNDVK